MNEYLEMTRQTRAELMEGSSQTGMNYVLELIPKAIKEKKKIVWKIKDLELGTGEYLLEDIR